MTRNQASQEDDTASSLRVEHLNREQGLFEAGSLSHKTSFPQDTYCRMISIRETVANRIAAFLDEHPDDSHIARELLQNSDDAGATVQWYLLDHTHHFLNQTDEPKLFHKDLLEYMGPALLAGNDSVSQAKEFKPIRNSVYSEGNDEAKTDHTGFNSIYHLTDCPSFITGDQFMVVEPHERIFNGEEMDLTDGVVREGFVENNAGLNRFPDQLKTFSVLEDLDFSKSYPGTIFRFPLRTQEQANISSISKSVYSIEKVRDILLKLKDEALRCILFLKYIERIEIYERKEGRDRPSMLFRIEIVNAEVVREERQRLLTNLRAHINPDQSSSRDAVLKYTISPIFKLTQEDGTITQETWHITTTVGNTLTTREYIARQPDADLSNHRLTPWVGIGAPVESGTNIDISRLFCFLPTGIQIPLPVHINGHFDVKQSRPETWTDASTFIKSAWNTHLFKNHIPVAYARFLDTLGISRGPTYDLWPVPFGDGMGLDAIWKDLLTDTLRVVCRDNLRVFFCGSEGSNGYRVVDYKSSWIVTGDIDQQPIVLNALRCLVNAVTGLPDFVLKTIPRVVKSLGLESRILTPASVRDILREHKDRWIGWSSITKVGMLKYCIKDGRVNDLEGLPLLPLVGDQWVDFNSDESHNRFFVPENVFNMLMHSNDGVVDLKIDAELVNAFKERDGMFGAYWSVMDITIISKRIKDIYLRHFYGQGEDEPLPAGVIQQKDSFPSRDWIMDFWEMIRSLTRADRKTSLSLLKGIHLLPITQGRLAPLSKDDPVICLNYTKYRQEKTLTNFLQLLKENFGYRVLRLSSLTVEIFAAGYVVEVSNVVDILHVLAKVEKDKLQGLSQDLREVFCAYIEKWLPINQKVVDDHLQTLKSLPIYRMYRTSMLEPLHDLDLEEIVPECRVAWRFKSPDYPWLPTSFKLLAHGQSMGRHFPRMKINNIREADYWLLIMSNLDHHPEGSWDSIMERFSSMYTRHSMDHDFVPVMRNLPFVRVTGRNRREQVDGKCGLRRPPRLVASRALTKFYMSHEDVFPVGVYSRPPVYGILAEMGMRSSFDASFIMDRLGTLCSRPSRRDSGIFTDDYNNDGDSSYLEDLTGVLLALYAKMNTEFTRKFASQQMQELLCSSPWILAKSPQDANHRLCMAQESRLKSDYILIGDQMPMSIFDFSNKDIIHCVGWDQPPPLDKVLAHFLTVIDRLQSECVPDEDARAVAAIYYYLQKKFNNPLDLKAMKDTLSGKPWVLVKKRLHPANRVALQIICDLSPHLVEATTYDARFKSLFLAMGVREAIRLNDLQSLISAVATRYSEGDTITAADSDFVVKLLQGMTHPDIEFEWTEDLLVPTVDHGLCKTKNVVFNDVGLTDMSTIEEISSYSFADGKITKPMAERLRVPMLSTTYWIHQSDLKFDPWPEEEDLLGVIGDILGDYSPSNIFKEFLEIAIVSGATKCSFLLDRASHPRHKIICPEMATWQGPALVIYNDAELSEDDFTALCSFETGDQDSNSSIGRQGYNFSSVYHFTDVPSIVSGSYIGFLDPRQEYLPSKDTCPESSQRCKLSKLMNGILSDQLAPYLDLFDGEIKSHFKGTIIRIPLRTLEAQEQSGLERVIGQVWTIGQIQAMFRTWVEDAKVGMLFSEKLATIEIKDNIRGNADFGWCATKTVGSGWAQLDSMLNEQSHEHGVPSTTQIVDIHVTTSGSTETESWKWLVHTEHELPQDASQEAKVIVQELQWNVDRGIAIPLDCNIQGASFRRRMFRGRMITHVPTSIQTGLPFHIFGTFAQTPSIEGTTKSLKQGVWIRVLIEKVLPSTAVNAFERLLQWMFRGVDHGGPGPEETERVVPNYFQLWPFEAKGSAAHCRDIIETFISLFICKSFGRPIFPSGLPQMMPPMEFLKGQDVIFVGLDLKAAPGSVRQTICERLWDQELKVCDCPDELVARIQEDMECHPTLDYHQISPDMVRELIRQDPRLIPDSLSSDVEKRWMLEYTMRALLVPGESAAMKEPLTGLALIPLVNGEWKEIRSEGPSSPVYYAVDPVMMELMRESDILIDVRFFDLDMDYCRQGSGSSRSTLRQILDCLVEDPAYRVKKMMPHEIASFFRNENPDGISRDLRDRIWKLLDSYDDLRPFGEIPVLTTLDGASKPLKWAFQGLEISSARDVNLKQSVLGLSSLLKDLGIVVVDATQNYKHRFFYHLPTVKRGLILSAITNFCVRPWPSGRALTKREVYILRDMIDKSDDNEIRKAVNLGHLRLWESWGPSPAEEMSELICANGSYFVPNSRSINWGALGQNSDLICHTNYSHFAAMGAKPLRLISAVETRVLPQFLDGSLSCTGATKEAYIEVFKEITAMFLMSRQSGNGTNEAARNLLQNKAFILTRDGSFQSSRKLFDPDDILCTAILGDTPSKFPDPSLWALIKSNNLGHLLSIRSSKDPDVVRECANHILEITQGPTELSPDLVLSKAIAMVDFIYGTNDRIDWMDPRWKIVPAEIASQSPYSGRVPNLPAYLSFKELVDPSWRDVTWTQCAFFHKLLMPSDGFKQRFNSVGVPSVGVIVDHLKVLATELAPIWTSLVQEEALKSALLAVYRTLDQKAAQGSAIVSRMLQEKLNGVAYIFGGQSWFEPHELMLDLQYDMGYFCTVPNELRGLRRFLEAAGVKKMQAVESTVGVQTGRKADALEACLLKSFKDQDLPSGLMDVRFIFADGQQILAHKVLLIHMSEYFKCRLTGAWSKLEVFDPLNPRVTTIDLSNHENYEVFYGLLYYLYTDRLIASNGPVERDCEAQGSNDSNDSNVLRDRLQYLVDLLHLSDECMLSRLTTLIAHEIVTKKRVNHDNVFDVRGHVEHISDGEDILKHCNQYLKKNAPTIQTQLEREVQELMESREQRILEGLSELNDLEEQIQEVLNNREVLRTVASGSG